ncbi:MAG: 1-(5-phosphoribosyl)-5-[(5-phosphoribosylamino)methylideneamino]imidazole-4-carboxamide isomerase [Candidatus Omnitrophota bacterium]
MLIIPAIDIKDGCVVRLRQGRFCDKKVYSSDPLKLARRWAREGARLIHIVDLDGAASGKPKNLALVKRIAKNTSAAIQFGGGVRQAAMIKTLLDSGVRRVVLGTRAVQDRDFLKKAYKRFGDRIIVSIDAKRESLLIRGWQKAAKDLSVLKFARALKEGGMSEFIYTDILKDGTLEGPNTKAIKNLLKKTGMKIIASGGISSLADIYKLKSLEKYGLRGVIIGKALYEGKFSLKEALSSCH